MFLSDAVLTLDSQYPYAMGIGRHTVLRHMREHVLLPSVRMASIVRSLTSLAETLRCTLHQIDDDTGEVMVDIRNTELYLKVINQIHNVYKTDASKMMFGPQQNQQQQPSGAHQATPTLPAGPAAVSK